MDDPLMIVLRLIHIVFGAFWVGSAVFLALILEPRLRALGPTYQGPVMGAIAPVMGPAIGTAAVLTILAGIWMSVKLYSGRWDLWSSTGWGYAILFGAIAAVIAFGFGMATGVLANKMTSLGSLSKVHPHRNKPPSFRACRSG